jgi:hypothetical protein
MLVGELPALIGLPAVFVAIEIGVTVPEIWLSTYRVPADPAPVPLAVALAAGIAAAASVSADTASTAAVT